MAGVNFNRIGRIFISHLHGDHYLGLMGLLSSMHLQGRLRELHVYGLWNLCHPTTFIFSITFNNKCFHSAPLS